MIVLGLLLIVLSVGATAVAVTAPAASSQVIEMSALGLKVSASPLAMFLAGALSVLLLGLGFAMVSGGTRRKARARKELRELRRDQVAPDATASTSTGPGESSSRRDRLHEGTGAAPGETPARESSAGTSPEGRPDSAPPA